MFLQPFFPIKFIWITAPLSLYLMALIAFRDGITIRRVGWLFGHTIVWSHRDWLIIFLWLCQFGVDLRFGDYVLPSLIWLATLGFYAMSMALVHKTFYNWGLRVSGDFFKRDEYVPSQFIWRPVQILPPFILWLIVRLNI